MHRCSALEPRARSCQRVLHAAPRAAIALAASSPVCLTAIAGAADHTPDVRTRSATPDAFIYINYATGERIVSTVDAGPVDGADANLRGHGWSWRNDAIDPCAPDGYTDPLTTWVFTKVHDEDLGDDFDADSVGYWHDWFEYPPDTIVNFISLTTFSQIPDVDSNGDKVGDGVEGLDWFMVFTENDDPNNRENAIAHSPILIDSIPGSLDVGSSFGDLAGDGVIGFQEGQVLRLILDLSAGDAPTDIEIGDSNGVSDGSFGLDSIYSGIPGVDLDGDGLINGGFVVGFRQPGVTEGNGIIARFPELATLGLENPEGSVPDASTFPNILPVGFPLAGPSDNIESYQNRPPNQIDWPYNPDYTPNPSFGEGVGGIDGYARIDADGVDTGLQAAGFFACDPNTTFPPFTASPWFTCEILFNPSIEPPKSCNPADNAEPFFVLDLADIAGFVTGFQAGCNAAVDIAPPFGVCDLADISLFVTEFQAGCP